MAIARKGPEIQAGIVVIVGLLILALGMYLVSGGKEQFEAKSKYTVYFKNAGGLGRGDSVYLAGQKVGKVDHVETRQHTYEGVRSNHVAVVIEIGAAHEVPVDSDIKSSQTITGIVTMRINYGESKELADSDTSLHGRKQATFEEAVDEAVGLLDHVKSAVKEVDGLVQDARGQVKALDFARVQTKIDKILDTVQRSADGIETIIKDAKEPIDGTLGKAEGAAGNLEELSAALKRDWAEMEGKIQTILNDVKDASGNLKGIASENREGIKSIVQNLDDASRRIAPTVEKIEAVAKGANETLIELRPKLLKTVEAAAKGFESFAAVTENLKTAPWKLINTPSDDESDQVHLYNAARLYIEAASRISDNIEDLDTLRRLGVLEDPARKELAEKVIGTLDQSLKDFREREQKLVELMKAAKN